MYISSVISNNRSRQYLNIRLTQTIHEYYHAAFVTFTILKVILKGKCSNGVVLC